MTKYFFQRINIYVKSLFIIVYFTVLLGYGFKTLSQFVQQRFLEAYNISFEGTYFFSTFNFQPLMLAFFGFLLLSAILLIDIFLFSRRVNESIASSLEEYKLKDEFPNLYSSAEIGKIKPKARAKKEDVLGRFILDMF